jgi:hypothetical protein
MPFCASRWFPAFGSTSPGSQRAVGTSPHISERSAWLSEKPNVVQPTYYDLSASGQDREMPLSFDEIDKMVIAIGVLSDSGKGRDDGSIVPVQHVEITVDSSEIYPVTICPYEQSDRLRRILYSVRTFTSNRRSLKRKRRFGLEPLCYFGLFRALPSLIKRRKDRQPGAKRLKGLSWD